MSDYPILDQRRALDAAKLAASQSDPLIAEMLRLLKRFDRAMGGSTFERDDEGRVMLWLRDDAMADIEIDVHELLARLGEV